jgi:tRNA(fMet)-specific endonuclease VapC
VAYLLDAGTLAEVLRAVPSARLVRRLAGTPPRDRWTSVISVSQILVAARRSRHPKLMQDVVRLVSAVRVAPFDLAAAQVFAKFRATVAIDAETDDIMIASIAEALDFTLVTRRPGDFRRFPHLRVEDWTV